LAWEECEAEVLAEGEVWVEPALSSTPQAARTTNRPTATPMAIRQPLPAPVPLRRGGA
jgi:hypothetical protein